MLRRDRMLLESLTRKYGKDFVINEMARGIKNYSSDEQIEKEKEAIFNYLSNPNFKISFKKDDYNAMIGDTKYFFEKDLPTWFVRDWTYKLDKLFGEGTFEKVIKREVNLYKIAIWNGGYRVFDENSRYRQAEVVYHGNNTSKVYYILCEKGSKCTLVYFERGNYGSFGVVGVPYHFTIKTNSRKKANPLEEWLKALSIEELELVTGVDCEDYDNEKEFRKECKKWWTNLTPTKQERYYNKFDKVFQRMKN